MIKDKLTKEINNYHASIKDDVRNYIGASIIGSDCLRQIWYEFKAEAGQDISSQVRRTWMIGKHLENLILDWLSDANINIKRNWGDLSSRRVHYFKGHVDCIWIKDNKPYAIIEIKTANDASYNSFIKKGVKEWDPRYYAQIQSYMGMSGILNAYIIVLNKNNSAISDELVIFDEKFYIDLEDKALMIGEAYGPPPKISSSPIWFQCKLCKFHRMCHTK